MTTRSVIPAEAALHANRRAARPAVWRAGIQRRSSHWTLAFAGVTAIPILLVAVFAEPLAENQSRFGQVTGSVEILSQGAVEWVEAHIDLPLEVGDQIRVGEDGTAELSLAKNVLILLEQGTEVVVNRVTAREGGLSLRRGAVLGKVEAEGGSEGRWRFETPLAVCAIRGTEFALTHSDEDGTHLGVFNGAIEMTPAETAEGTAPPLMINRQEEGVIEKRKPLRKMTAFSPMIRSQFARVTHLQRRFPRVASVWVPLTPAYRMELRRKYIAPAKVRKAPPRRQPARRQPRS